MLRCCGLATGFGAAPFSVGRGSFIPRTTWHSLEILCRSVAASRIGPFFNEPDFSYFRVFDRVCETWSRGWWRLIYR